MGKLSQLDWRNDQLIDPQTGAFHVWRGLDKHLYFVHGGKAMLFVPEITRQRNELLDMLADALPFVEECEQFNKPTCRGLSKRIKAIISNALNDIQGPCVRLPQPNTVPQRDM